MNMARAARKQADLPGIPAREERPKIEESAEDLRAITVKISELQSSKRAAQAALLSRMLEEGVTIHKYPDADSIMRCARIKSVARACVEREKGQKSSDDEEADETKDDGGVEVS
jgi:hypothetical protein